MKNILLVEDDPEISSLLNLHFSSQTYNLIAAANGKDAMDEVLKTQFSLIILDITLPDINGMELCKLLRKNNVNAPIMMLTSHGDESDKVLPGLLANNNNKSNSFGVKSSRSPCMVAFLFTPSTVRSLNVITCFLSASGG